MEFSREKEFQAGEHRGNSLPVHIVDQLRRMRREGVSIRGIAGASGVARSTVEKYCRGLPSTVAAEEQGEEAEGQGDSREDFGEDSGEEVEEQEEFQEDRGQAHYDRLLDEYLADD